MMLDFHLHLARLPEPELLAKVLLERGNSFIAIACEPWEWEIIDKMALNEGGSKAFGIHPMIAASVTEDDWTQLCELLEKNPDAAVGECGIDKRYEGYGSKDNSPGIQEQVFRRQVELARDLNRDLQIHCVGDYSRIVKTLKDCGFPKAESAARPVFHRFGGDISIARAAQGLKPIFSLHADSFRKKSTLAAIAEIPPEQVRFETDADESFFAQEASAARNGDSMQIEAIADRLIAQLQAVKTAYDSKI